MPQETKEAIAWALTQADDEGNLVTLGNPLWLVTRVRDYFNANSIAYQSFCYDDLTPFFD